MPAAPAYQSRWSSAKLSTAADSAATRRDVVQLEARQLDRDHVVRLGVHDGLRQRQADVAGGDAAQPGRAEDRVQHLHGRGLAVGAGDAQPRGRVLGVAQPPRQLHLAPHRDSALPRLHQQRRVGAEARATRPAGRRRRAVSRSRPRRRRNRAPSASSSSARGWSFELIASATVMTSASRCRRLSTAAAPLAPKPATTARTPRQESLRPRVVTSGVVTELLSSTAARGPWVQGPGSLGLRPTGCRRGSEMRHSGHERGVSATKRHPPRGPRVRRRGRSPRR